jgi:hypothetical protein
MVYRDGGNYPPTKKFAVHAEAEAEARRLSEKEHSTFFILESESVIHYEFTITRKAYE